MHGCRFEIPPLLDVPRQGLLVTVIACSVRNRPPGSADRALWRSNRATALTPFRCGSAGVNPQLIAFAAAMPVLSSPDLPARRSGTAAPGTRQHGCPGMTIARAAGVQSTNDPPGGQGPRPCGISLADRRRSHLMQSAQHGDRVAYERLLKESMVLVRRVARHHAMAEDRIDDLIQETLLTMHRVRQTFDPSRSFDAWLGAIARRRMIDLWRQDARTGRREIHDDGAYETYADTRADPAATLDLESQRQRLREAVATLPPAQRHAVEHLGMLGELAADVARATGQTAGALRVNLHRALRALRAQLSDGSS